MGRDVSIKGIRDGLLVTVGEGVAYTDVVTQLEAELRAKRDFLQGSRIALAVGKRPFTRQRLSDLQALFTENDLELWTVLADTEATRTAARDLGLATRLPGSNTDLDGNVLHTGAAPVPADAKGDPSRAGALFLKETIRSGRSVYHEGNVTVIGDVNPGAEIIAAGDVVVWGRLRGLVHAGALGEETAVICALDLNPTQLRIANQIAIPPDNRPGQAMPEQAAIKNGRIVAEPWQIKSRD